MSSIVDQVQERYGAIARRAAGEAKAEDAGCGCDCGNLGCCGDDGNLNLGCGDPLALLRIEPGATVLDLGSGAGFDAFLAAERAGPTGRVIGVDMTPDMLALARRNAEARGVTNVEFREGRIEALPLEDASVDFVISNCVVNLSVDKPAVFREVARVLRPGGRLSVSDLVLIADLPESVRASVDAYVGCVAGTSHLESYIDSFLANGFREVAVERVTSAASMLAAGGDGTLSAEDRAHAARALVSATFLATR